MDDLAVQHDIEAIKQLKARYCRYLDAKDWVAWRALFTDDFVSDTTESGGELITGADAFVAFLRKNLGKKSQITVHQVVCPEVQVTSPTTADGTWALHDIVRLAPGLTLDGYGNYHERYRKVDGRWLIATSKLTRLREDIRTPLFSVRMSNRVRDIGAKLARRQEQ